MKTLIRDYLIGAIITAIMFAVVGWINAPTLRSCAKTHSAEYCYEVIK